MNKHSQSIGNRLNRMALAVGGARAHAKDLPKETAAVADALDKQHKAIQTADVEQEQAKRALAMKTQELKYLVRDAEQNRMRIIRFAEGQFGPRDPRIQEFRPATQGRHRKPKQKTDPTGNK